MTPRLEREARAWAGARRPANIATPGPGQRSVWDFPRPPAVERVLDRVRVEMSGVVLADSLACLRVCETASPPTYYLPMADIRQEHLRAAAGGSMCEWKGRASYYDVVVGDRVGQQAAWWYPEIASEYRMLSEHVAFYASRVDRCTVGDEVVEPQPGGFYAGWITSELTGPWKGGPGSSGW
ncbi:MAG: DUF427 domain-containing protein [Deltaproteobacteria bacterium]|nr:DUF427 domain-containing protein [Deltaproteobacteria bacterium]